MSSGGSRRDLAHLSRRGRIIAGAVVALVLVIVAAGAVALLGRDDSSSTTTPAVPGSGSGSGTRSGPGPSAGKSPTGSGVPGATNQPPARGQFQSVAVGSGGLVTGMSISDDGKTRLVRTDGDGYRWDPARNRWVLDVSATSLPAADVKPGLGLSVLAVAVAPSDAQRAYMAFNNAVYSSNDAAKTWKRVLSNVPTAPNDAFRTRGSRLEVDPKDPDVVFYGSQLDGMYITRNGGSSWTHVPDSQVPAGTKVDLGSGKKSGDLTRVTDRAKSSDGGNGDKTATAGISAVAVDPSGPVVDGQSQVVYAASYGTGIYRSDNGGRTWARTGPDDIRSVDYLRVADNGTVLVTSHKDVTDKRGNSQVWRFDGHDWTESGPDKAENWTKIAIDPTKPGLVALMAKRNAKLALSENYGKTWTLVKKHEQTSAGDVPWLAWSLNFGTSRLSAGEILFDPVKSGRLWLTEGTGVWYTDLDPKGSTPSSVTWHSQSRGIEHLVATNVIVPPGGKPLLTAWDRAIFRSNDPLVYPEYYGPVNKFGSGWSIDYSLSDPSYIVADVASHHAPSDPSNSGYSTDGGKTWTPFPSIPEDSKNGMKTFGFGSMAVSDPGNVVWVPAFGKRPEYTTDGGKSWQPITLPGVDDYSLIDAKPYYVNRQVIAADKKTPGTFYLFVDQTGTFRSTDGGKSWDLMSDAGAMEGEDYAFTTKLKAVPGEEGELFITPGDTAKNTSQPFLHSTDGGKTWDAVSNLTGVTAFGFGKAFPGSDHPAIYASGYLKGRYGIYRSTDDAGSWTFLTAYPAGRTRSPRSISGDMNKVGRVYAAIASGWVFADTATAAQAASDSDN